MEFMELEAERIRRILSLNIKKMRKILGLSQERLAEAADLSAQTINDIEGCRMWVSDKTIVKLCQVFHVDAYQLLFPPLDEPNTAPVPSAILLNMQRNLKKNIDLQFEELFKSGVF
jgi:transcriptional regulator with XRE-family HTH domain